MKLLLAVVVLSVCLGYLFGGRLDRLEALRPRWWGLVILGLGIQFVPLPNGATGTDLVIRTAVLALSYSLLLTFALVNVRMPGMFLVVIGLACNMTVIVVNGGMPARGQAPPADGGRPAHLPRRRHRRPAADRSGRECGRHPRVRGTDVAGRRDY